jgi:hypothetical protein
MGGYGFFTSNNIVEKFDFKIKEWNFHPTKGERPLYISGLLFHRDSLIYLFNTFRCGNNTEPDLLEPYIYIFNISTNTWSKILNKNEFKDYVLDRSFKLKNYTITVTNDRTLIIDKKN